MQGLRPQNDLRAETQQSSSSSLKCGLATAVLAAVIRAGGAEEKAVKRNFFPSGGLGALGCPAMRS